MRFLSIFIQICKFWQGSRNLVTRSGSATVNYPHFHRFWFVVVPCGNIIWSKEQITIRTWNPTTALGTELKRFGSKQCFSGCYMYGRASWKQKTLLTKPRDNPMMMCLWWAPTTTTYCRSSILYARICSALDRWPAMWPGSMGPH